MLGKIIVSPAWVAFMGVLYYFDPLDLFTSFFMAILLHEMGHILALLVYGVPVRQFRLELSGAVLVTGSMDYRREIICSIAGPLANLLAQGLYGTYPVFAFACLLLATINLLPIYPLDGGRILRATLLLHHSESQMMTILYKTALYTAVFLLVIGTSLSLFFHAGIWPLLSCSLLFIRFFQTYCSEKKKQL